MEWLRGMPQHQRGLGPNPGLAASQLWGVVGRVHRALALTLEAAVAVAWTGAW